MNLCIRGATAADITALIEIEEEAFVRPHWGSKDFLEADCIVAEIDGNVAGFLVSRTTFQGNNFDRPEREILNLAVRKSLRRKGIAAALLRYELTRKGSFFLEVRESNEAALGLYRKFGFVEVGRRPYYYQHPDETAIVMNMK